MMMKHFVPIVLAATLATPAWADLSASAKVWNMSYSLEDLDPSDGVAPGITFDTLPEKQYSGAGLIHLLYKEPYRPHQVDDLQQYGGAFEPVSVSSTIQPVSFSVTGDGTMEGTLLDASASIDTVAGVHNSFAGGATVMNDQHHAYVPTFTLTPHTRVSFSARYSLEARLYYDDLVPQLQRDAISAEAGLLVYDASSVPLSYGPQLHYDQVTTVDWYGDWSQGAGYTRDGVLTGVITNVTGNPLAGGARFSVALHGESADPAIVVPPPAVPEPSVIANAFAGLALTGACLTARRRRAQGR